MVMLLCRGGHSHQCLSEGPAKLDIGKLNSILGHRAARIAIAEDARTPHADTATTCGAARDLIGRISGVDARLVIH